jgi:putative PIN family toxin of toxin-antitoxin system
VRVFLDTNVLVAAFATRGLCSDVVRAVLAEHDLVLSSTVLDELRRTLIEKLRVPEPTVQEIAVFLRASASLADTPSNPLPVVVRDLDDAVILGEALASGADVLVTGDKDLLEAGEVPGIRILDPRGFWELVRRQHPRDR